MIIKTAIQQQWNIIFPGSGSGYTIFKPVDVDNEKWYTIHVSEDIASWIRTQLSAQWYEHLSTQPDRYTFHSPHQRKFDVHYELLAILKLTWG
jgi:hypothetical protein